MIFRRAAILLGALLLTGCSTWSGPVFYPVDKSYSWLPHGTYRSQSEGESHDVRWDGKAFIELPSGKKQKEDDAVITLATLSGTKLDAYIAQISSTKKKEESAIYALVVRHGNVWTYGFPDCATTRMIVTDAGGSMDGPSGLRQETTTENVSMADLEADSAPLTKSRRAQYHRSSRHALPAASATPTDSTKIVQAGPFEGDGYRYGGQACHFPTQASLEAAARRYLAERQLIGDKVVRIGD